MRARRNAVAKVLLTHKRPRVPHVLSVMRVIMGAGVLFLLYDDIDDDAEENQHAAPEVSGHEREWVVTHRCT